MTLSISSDVKKDLYTDEVLTYHSQHRVVYNFPLKSVYHALSIYRSASPVGKINSREFNLDRVQISRYYDHVTLATVWHTFDVELELREIDHIYNQVVQAIKSVLTDCSSEQRLSFSARYIGHDYGSETGDVQTLTTAEIAEKLGKSRRTIERWIHDIRDDLEEELVKRGLMEPPNRH